MLVVCLDALLDRFECFESMKAPAFRSKAIRDWSFSDRIGKQGRVYCQQRLPELGDDGSNARQRDCLTMSKLSF